MKTAIFEKNNVLEPIIKKWRSRKRFKNLLQAFLENRKHTIIAEHDYYRILQAMKQEKKQNSKSTYVRRIRILLKYADVRAYRRVPNDVITMNTDFSIRTWKGKIINLKLVYPDEVDKSKRHTSVFSLLGVSLLGRRKGDAIRKNFVIHEIGYQPEARNDFI